MDIGYQLKAAYWAVQESLRNLDHLLHMAASNCQAKAAVIPPIATGQESIPIDEITIETQLCDTEAIDAAIECYSDLHAIEGLSKKAARRTVGSLSITTHQQAIWDCIQSLNGQKSHIQQLITNNFSNRQDRFRAMHETCPGIMTTHLYRSIHCLKDRDIASIRFSWQNKIASVQMDKEKVERLIKSLEEEIKAKPHMEVPLTQIINSIASCTPEKLRARRNVKVQPAANATNRNKKIVTIAAPMPIIVLQDFYCKIGNINSFDIKARSNRKKRSDWKKSEEIGSFKGFSYQLIS